MGLFEIYLAVTVLLGAGLNINNCVMETHTRMSTGECVAVNSAAAVAWPIVVPAAVYMELK